MSITKLCILKDSSMNSEIYFSICIPNFNYGSYIGRTIDSVLNQSYQNFEIVIVDNASTDNSWDVITFYENRDNRIKAFRNEYNVGFAPNLDRAALKASYDFIIMLSSDDIMHSNALETYATILNELGDKAQNFILTSAIDIIDQDDQLTGRQFREQYHNTPVSEQWPRLSDDSATIHDGLAVFKEVFPKMGTAGPFCATMFSKRMYDKVGGYSSINLIGPDAHFVYKVMLVETPIIFVNKCLFAYRVHNNSQLSQTEKNLNINVLIDRYIFTNLYSESQLNKAGVSKKEASQQIFDDVCLTTGLKEIEKGRYLFALRHLWFAFAAYPFFAARNYKSYMLFIGILFGPFTKVLIKIVRKFT